MHALEVCEDDRLKLALNLAFSCSLRMGEMLGLTWDCVDTVSYTHLDVYKRQMDNRPKKNKKHK